MTFAISREAMEKEFGAGHLIRVPADRINSSVTDAPTVRFLSEVGLPRAEEFVFTPDEELPSGLRRALDVWPGLADSTDEPADAWVVLGSFMGDGFLLDGASGAVRLYVEGEDAIRFMNTRIDFFARFLASFHRDRELLHPDFATPDEIEEAMNNLVVEMRGIDPGGVDHESGYWNDLADRVAWQY
ncbi:SUKH-4 family immunity protein [Streptomyces sp. ICBB 8177]|uniref:SUKH-4 family immunity protein n=1 Tax=Streptomyces sp. ICBB 8177 TaxID=563922 RepID=UPI000D67AF7F|nr:SUKH-4 family immunity protein [Streptomyces sp. ICBB 8177]PWI41609.1 hypothetical protein CK485_22365 [Streptomyces sp. ICBB 8177]